MSAGKTAAKTDEPFDERLARLEALVAELEGGGLGLEASMERYREGVALLKGCRTLLAGYERQVEELTREAELSAFKGDPDADGGHGAS
ncbi:MAG: exodeoxyribonuclease VII small subunit [Planctomycetota bacterium]|jgi:exodeoxyribonuclease VII small subunit|nr:exodeoxyribonuclease VII small subunit [Planctomycetota bacterium]MDP6838627.1 exodeoxyribonuclease VII small subunit [Planctomycetota bacterium]